MSQRSEGRVALIKAAVLAAFPELVRKWLPAGEQQGEFYVALNPMRNDRNLGSFRSNIGSGQWEDYSIGQGGRDAVSLYAYLFTDGDYGAAYRALANDPFVRATIATGIMAPTAKVAVYAKNDPSKLVLARRLYAQARELQGTPAAAYLQSRGLRPTVAWDCLRSAVHRYPRHGLCPVLLAPVDDLNGVLVGVQRTYLQPNGKKLDVSNPRMTLGQIRGSAIQLAEATDQLIICEGLEDGLTLFQDLGVPVWVACGAVLMRHITIPNTVRSLTIAADNDAAGQLAAQRAADAHNINGREVRIMRPDPLFKDFNDQLQGIRK